MFSIQQKKDAYEKMFPGVQDFIMSSETMETINGFLRETGLSEEEQIYADNEIFCAMIGLQTLPEAIANIAKNTNKNISDLSNLRSELEETIFDEIYKIQKNTPPQPIENGQSEEVIGAKIQKENSVGQSFEKIILNQAKAMQPAREQGWVPENLPAEKETEKPRATTPNYTGQDPYRETIE